MKSNSSSSVKSNSSTTTTMEEENENENENRDNSCYYPGCRKDANCYCDICLASFNATLDLMPMSTQKTSFPNLKSRRRPNVEKTPITFDPSILSTPRSSSFRVMKSPDLKSTARFNVKKKEEKRNKERKDSVSGLVVLLVVSILSLIFGLKFGVSRVVNWGFKPIFTKGLLKNAGERSLVANDMNASFRLLESELRPFVFHGKISNCGNSDSVWTIDQDDLLLISKCVLYRSTFEEVSIWGWPLQTAGLYTTGLSSKSFTILSGRIKEWANGKVEYSIRMANTSWELKGLSASVLQLDPNTWVLEYRRSLILNNDEDDDEDDDESRFLTLVAEFLKQMLSKVRGKIKEKLWMLSSFEEQQQQHQEITKPT